MEARERVSGLTESLVSGDNGISPNGLSADIALRQPLSALSRWFDSPQSDARAGLVDGPVEAKPIEPIQKRGIRVQAFLQLCQLLENEAAMNGEGRKLHAEEQYAAFIARLIHDHSAERLPPVQYKGGLPGYALRRVCEYVGGNLSSDVSLAQLARIAGMSAYHFARLFRQSMGVSPHQYLISRRVARARDLLTESSRPLAEISHEVGYESQSHFTAVFRKSTGLTPKVFRFRYQRENKG